jgi:hypothetical protein
MKNWQLPRRTFLKGLGTTMALPFLEAMSPLSSIAAAAKESGKAPQRVAFVYVPNGVNMADWTPAELGSDFKLPSILEPLTSVKDDLLVISGLGHVNGTAGSDGAGDHARASATFLTGCRARKTAGADIQVGVSIDQVAASKIGKFTRLSSLELGCDRGQQAGNCDSGYSCAYSYNISWKTESTPMPPEVDPRLVFERLFSSASRAETAEARAKRERHQRSILDFVLDDAKSLRSKLGATDQRKLDEYLTAVRELESRIDRAEKFAATLPDYKQPTGIPDTYEDHLKLMFDLLALAFQTDTTRISTFVVAHDGSNRPYPFIGVSEGHHDLSHHGGKEEKKQKIAQINQFHVKQFAYFIQRLKSIREGDGSLLDNCMVVYGSGLADGNAHAHEDLPIVMAGRGGNTIQTGRHIQFSSHTPMTNLYLSMMERVGAPIPRIGDSTGPLQQLG